MSKITSPYELSWEQDPEKGLLAMKDNRFDIYLLDYRLGKHSGLDMMREALNGGCTTPVILFTGLDDFSVDQKFHIF